MRKWKVTMTETKTMTICAIWWPAHLKKPVENSVIGSDNLLVHVILLSGDGSVELLKNSTFESYFPIVFSWNIFYETRQNYPLFVWCYEHRFRWWFVKGRGSIRVENGPSWNFMNFTSIRRQTTRNSYFHRKKHRFHASG